MPVAEAVCALPPVRDRIDIHRTLTLPSRPELARAIGRSQTTDRLAEVVAEARGRQSVRLDDTPWRLNSEVPGSELRKQWPVEDGAHARRYAYLQSRGSACCHRLDDMQICQSEAVQRLCCLREGCGRIAVEHVIEGARWRQTHTDPVSGHSLRHRFRHFQ